MEIARLEVSTQHHLDRMQETVKVNYVQYGKSTKHKKGKKSTQSGASGGNHRVTEAMEQVLSLVEKARSFHSHKTLATDVAKADTRKHRTVKLWMLCAEVMERKDTLRKSVSRLNVPHSLEVPQASTSSAGAGEPLYFDDDGQPIFTHMVSVLHANKHLIKFLIVLDYTILRKQVENSTNSTKHSQSVLLKADTGADVNLMNKQTFDKLFGDVKNLLQLTPIRMENYGNSAGKVLGMFHVFLRWKDKVYKQSFYVTDCD